MGSRIQRKKVAGTNRTTTKNLSKGTTTYSFGFKGKESGNNIRETVTIRGSDQWKTTTHRHPDGSFTRTTTKTTKKPRNKKTVFKKGGRHKSAAVQNRETMRSAKRINRAVDSLENGNPLVGLGLAILLLIIWFIFEVIHGFYTFFANLMTL